MSNLVDPMFFVLYDRQQFEANKREFADFLGFDFNQGKYGDKIQRMIEEGETRLMVSIDDLREFRPELAKNLLKKPGEYIPALEQALKEEASRILAQMPQDDNENRDSKEEILQAYTVGLEGHFGAHEITPRELSASFIGQIVMVEGIVTKLSLVHPKLVKSVHYCKATGEQLTRFYRDSTSTIGIPTNNSYLTKDENGNPLSTEYGLSTYRDHQTMTVQEMPEKAPPGQLPCSVDVIIEDDLVDQVKPGDRVQVCGIYKSLASKVNGHTNAIFKTLLICNSVRQFTKEIKITEKDIENIKSVSKTPDIFTKMSQSLAPSIFGHDYIKKALLLLLLGGVEKNLENKTHLRGDINILLIGDPSTAKSQLLRFVLHTAPLAINTTGRGSSGVGLTAAVVSDKETGERRLEAGAMVLADGGVVCIDEFDKMSEEDRVAIHEVMEQQTVTIAKAGIHCALNARCSVLAAANPIYGQYNRQKKPNENIALPDSLLSRFDLLFIFLDELNPETDRHISDHVMRMHRYKHPNDNGEDGFMQGLMNDNAEKDENTTPVYQKYDKLLHGNRKKQEIFSIPFIKKYLLYAKFRVAPKLTDEANSLIANSYAQLRSKEDMKTLPITVRTLETMIRLATAHAKARLSPEVTEDDAKVAIDIVNFALYHESASETLEAVAKRKQPDDPNNKRKKPKTTNGTTTTTTATADPAEDEMEVEEEIVAQVDEVPAGKQEEEDEDTEVTMTSQKRKGTFSKKLSTYFNKQHLQECTIKQLEQAINKDVKNPAERFSKKEMEVYLNQMMDEGNVVYADGEVRLV